MKKENKLKNNKKLKKFFSVAYKILVIIAFLVLAVILSNNHEHWSDEAQSFLIARDNSVLEILNIAKYEGTPPLWFFIIKVFLKIGGSYELFHLIPIVFSLMGVVLFEFKIKAPWYLKILLPFTYFIFYQYTIIARSYSLIFLVGTLLLLAYEKRFERPIVFSLILFIFMNICAYTFIIAGSIYLLYIYESLKILTNKNKKEDKECFKEEKEIKLPRKRLYFSLILILIMFLLITIMLLPAEGGVYGKVKKSNIMNIFLEATFVSSENISIWFTILFFIFLVFALRKEKNKYKLLCSFIILFLPVMLFSEFITIKNYHIGIFTMLFIGFFIANNLVNKNIFIKLMFIVMCILQIYWSVKAGISDYWNKYSAAKEIANYIKEKDYDEKIIYGYGYSITAINPYFEKNIFKNQNTEKSYHLWLKEQGYNDKIESLDDEDVKVYIISIYYREC